MCTGILDFYCGLPQLKLKLTWMVQSTIKSQKWFSAGNYQLIDDCIFLHPRRNDYSAGNRQFIDKESTGVT
jgi:hypothetical protein